MEETSAGENDIVSKEIATVWK